jgi:pimeloyl-ACP methyl ester carboxylesterase
LRTISGSVADEVCHTRLEMGYRLAREEKTTGAGQAMTNGASGDAGKRESVTGESVFYSASDGLRLHAADYGRHDPATRDRLPVVCLPGLTRNTRDFDDLAKILSTDPKAPRRVVSFDYRGRGGSAWDKDPSRYTITVEAEDVLSGMAALGLEHAIFIGTSRGGLIMHVLAATRPGVMAAGVLNDIGPVIEGAGLAQIKAYLSRMPNPNPGRMPRRSSPTPIQRASRPSPLRIGPTSRAPYTWKKTATLLPTTIPPWSTRSRASISTRRFRPSGPSSKVLAQCR